MMQQQDRRSPSLPARLSSFVGRVDAIQAVATLLSQHRLVTLVGAPGVGKTRLAVEVASGLDGAHADAIAFVPLAGLAEPEPGAGPVAGVLGVAAQAGRPTTEVLQEHLHARRLLLVLDNCEHLLAACAALAEALLLRLSGPASCWRRAARRSGSTAR